ncbi:MAG: shikimate dehydrogenase [Gammaproteobacteria bacterium]
MAERLAVFGHPVAHSLSPGIHRTFAEQTGRTIEFELIDAAPEALADAVRAFASRGGVGANVTVPHKLAALELVDAASDRAKLAGAVNLLRFESRTLVFGDNSDGAGLATDITENLGVALTGMRVLIVGAGGACRGIVAPLLAHGPAEIVIANRTHSTAQQVAARFAFLGRVVSSPLASAGTDYDVVINATSASITGELPALRPSVFGSASLAYDLFYTKDGETAFTRWAMQNGAARTADGWGMLVEQAVECWRVWFGITPDAKPLLR